MLCVIGTRSVLYCGIGSHCHIMFSLIVMCCLSYMFYHAVLLSDVFSYRYYFTMLSRMMLLGRFITRRFATMPPKGDLLNSSAHQPRHDDRGACQSA
jgi:hypothetical protein